MLTTEERVVIDPKERRAAVLEVVRAARKRLRLSLFRCNDDVLIEELTKAAQRGVTVEALVTQRAKGWQKRLDRLRGQLSDSGVTVHVYADPVVKYHAKFIVADTGPSLVGSLNFTRKCFKRTSDFVVVTGDPTIAAGLISLFEADLRDTAVPADVPWRLIVGPEFARPRLEHLLKKARRSIRIIDRKVTDPGMLALLRAKQAEGVDVTIVEGEQVCELASHGQLLVIDDTVAVIGSIALSSKSLAFRREVSIIVDDTFAVERLSRYVERAGEGQETRPVLEARPE
jgi:cardiolipin synthase